MCVVVWNQDFAYNSCLEPMYELRCLEKPGYVTSKQASWETKYLHNRPLCQSFTAAKAKPQDLN